MFRRIARNLLSQERNSKRSVRAKRQQAARNPQYLLKLLKLLKLLMSVSSSGNCPALLPQWPWRFCLSSRLQAETLEENRLKAGLQNDLVRTMAPVGAGFRCHTPERALRRRS